MAQLQLQPEITGKTKRKHHKALNIDMTPMVDLGFLLITFFIFTTAMGEQTSVSLSMPAQGLPLHIPESKTLTLILGKENRVFAYEGIWENAIKNNNISISDYNVTTGISHLIRVKQSVLESEKPGSSKEMIVLIKPHEQSSYANLVNALDEMLIHGVSKYAVVDAEAGEKNFIEKYY